MLIYIDVTAIQRIMSTEDNHLKTDELCASQVAVWILLIIADTLWIIGWNVPFLLQYCESLSAALIYSHVSCVLQFLSWWHSSTCWNLLSVLLYHYQLHLYCYRHKGLWACCSIVCVCSMIIWSQLSLVMYCLPWFDIHKSVHHHTIQINQPTRCNSFTSLLLDVYVWLSVVGCGLAG
jgi:hypothetical protein